MMITIAPTMYTMLFIQFPSRELMIGIACLNSDSPLIIYQCILSAKEYPYGSAHKLK